MTGTQGSAETGRQRDLLLLVLAAGPAGLGVAGLEARLGDPAEIAIAIEALVAEELLVREGERVVPTPAAIRFYELRQLSGQL